MSDSGTPVEVVSGAPGADPSDESVLAQSLLRKNKKGLRMMMVGALFLCLLIICVLIITDQDKKAIAIISLSVGSIVFIMYYFIGSSVEEVLKKQLERGRELRRGARDAYYQGKVNLTGRLKDYAIDQHVDAKIDLEQRRKAKQN